MGRKVRGRGRPRLLGRWPSSPQGSIPAAKAPHFSRLGDVEVNAGQNATFQCMAAGRAAEAERFLLQVSGGWGCPGCVCVGGGGGPWPASYEKFKLRCGGLRPSVLLQHPNTRVLVHSRLSALLSAPFFRHRSAAPGSPLPAIPHPQPHPARAPHSRNRPHTFLGQGWFQESHTSLGSFGMAKWGRDSLPLRLPGSD